MQTQATPNPPGAATTTTKLPPAGSETPPATPRRWNSQTLFGLDREVEIEHAGQLYRLRQTSLGKLILTK
ncbi:hemin uptake protein HemP [Pelomonas sp. KK5]|uniref:hemin uptake protein HemP n=1 Tax=Pelomonas sp. KK5 TaxID=1855730 RepID=UPI0009FA600B|nr:hemin uptake protein HemP [Pelomonas sp. KK5]